MIVWNEIKSIVQSNIGSFIILLLFGNLITFIIYFLDKEKAKKKQWRISERALLLCAMLLGAFGAFSAMLVFHHKTQHKRFMLLIPLFLIIQSILIVLFFF
ncbi:MAG: DUF1294 domain-containing protein [Christensenellales bacterium]